MGVGVSADVGVVKRWMLSNLIEAANCCYKYSTRLKL